MRVFAVLLALLLALLLTACATPPPAPRVEHLFHDELFGPPSERVGSEGVFALSEPMRRYLRVDIADQLRDRGLQVGLVDALYRKGQLKLEYDAAMTRNAAEAFDARAGNCLSLVIMTAALAKELGLQVRYQSAYLEEAWSRSGDLLLRSGHVNVTLDRGIRDAGRYRSSIALTIDFLPSEEIRGLRTVELSEDTVVAMFMNNRAVEALVQDRTNDAYAWARASIRQSPAFMSAQNTLGLVYLRRGALTQAAEVFSQVLATEPENTRAMANLAETLTRQGRFAEAVALQRRLAQIEPYPPYYYFNLGLAAMRRDDYRAARDLFAKEVSRADYQAEFHYWLGVASFRLGDFEHASKHLTLAREFSTSRGDREIYAAKLAWVKAHSPK